MRQDISHLAVSNTCQLQAELDKDPIKKSWTLNRLNCHYERSCKESAC